MEEIWKEIKGYNGDYHVSTYGRVKSYKGRNKDGKILKPSSNKNGYLHVGLSKNRNVETHSIHRLVAFAFVENLNVEEFTQVNHIDEKPPNNRADNLEWCDGQYNTEYSQAKHYKILFPDGREEIIFNLKKFCRENILSEFNMKRSFEEGWFHKNYKLLEIIEKDGSIKKSKMLQKIKYKILFPDGHEEIIFDFDKFCCENNIVRGYMNKTFIFGNKHKGFKLIERIDRNGNITKAKEFKRKSFKILFPDDHIEIIFNLMKFCREYDLNKDCLNQGFKMGYYHKGFKILEKIDKDGIITKSKK